MGSGAESFQSGFRKATKYSDEEKDAQDVANDMSVRQKASAMLSDMGEGADDALTGAAELLGLKPSKKKMK